MPKVATANPCPIISGKSPRLKNFTAMIKIATYRIVIPASDKSSDDFLRQIRPICRTISIFSAMYEIRVSQSKTVMKIFYALSSILAREDLNSE